MNTPTVQQQLDWLHEWRAQAGPTKKNGRKMRDRSKDKIETYSAWRKRLKREKIAVERG
jgi:hypothetical protein